MNAMPKSQAIQHLQKVLDGIAHYSPTFDITSQLDLRNCSAVLMSPSRMYLGRKESIGKN